MQRWRRNFFLLLSFSLSRFMVLRCCGVYLVVVVILVSSCVTKRSVNTPSPIHSTFIFIFVFLNELQLWHGAWTGLCSQTDIVLEFVTRAAVICLTCPFPHHGSTRESRRLLCWAYQVKLPLGTKWPDWVFRQFRASKYDEWRFCNSQSLPISWFPGSKIVKGSVREELCMYIFLLVQGKKCAFGRVGGPY